MLYNCLITLNSRYVIRRYNIETRNECRSQSNQNNSYIGFSLIFTSVNYTNYQYISTFRIYDGQYFTSILARVVGRRESVSKAQTNNIFENARRL